MPAAHGSSGSRLRHAKRCGCRARLTLHVPSRALVHRGVPHQMMETAEHLQSSCRLGAARAKTLRAPALEERAELATPTSQRESSKPPHSPDRRDPVIAHFLSLDSRALRSRHRSNRTTFGERNQRKPLTQGRSGWRRRWSSSGRMIDRRKASSSSSSWAA